MFVIAIALFAITSNLVHGHVTPRKFELEGRIKGGKNITIEDAPYQVSVRFRGKHLAGGSILSKRVILSGEHVFVYPLFASLYSIQYGTSVIGGNENVITARRILYDRNADRSGYDNDIALMILATDIIFNTLARPIKLASTAPAVGTYADITGWGFLKENGMISNNLQKASIQIMDRTICQKQYDKITDISEKMLCAGVIGGGKDACKYDSGGPLVSNGELVGTISFGIGCGRNDHYGIYTNIAAYKNWIVTNMKQI